LVTPQAAFISGTLSLRFKASSVPSGGWKVYGTSSNNTVAGTSLIYTVPTTQLDGFPGWYGFDSTTAATPLTYLRVERATNSGCWQTVATSTTTPVTIDAPNLGADEDGANCGTLNVFCQLKAALSWAFIPSETAVDDAQATFEGLADKVPWGYATAAYEFTDKVLERAETGCDTSPTAQASCALRFGISDNEFGLAPTNDLDVVVLADGSPGGELMDSLRPIVGAGVWFVLLGGLAFWLFRKLAPGGGDS
jgi:hypothetical protein